MNMSEQHQSSESDTPFAAIAPRERARRQARRRARVAAVIVVAAAGVGVLVGHSWSGGSPQLAATGSSAAQVTACGGSTSSTTVASTVDPGLVDVNTTLSYQDAAGAGTGLVLTPSGEVVTNIHVVEGATHISVTDIGNGKTYGASVVGYDPSKDLAVLQLKDASGLQTVTLGDSSSAAVGESVIGIGNAGGAGGTPSTAGGSITALNQSITAGDDFDGLSEQLSGLIETNANIRPGDSGGPLVNAAGQVLGIDTAGSQTFVFQTATTQAYAIPIDTVLTVVKAIEAGESSSTVHVGATGFIGIGVQPSIQTPTPGGSGGFGGVGYGGYGYGAYGTGNGVTTPSGLIVANILAGEPGSRAGLAQGDVITTFAGKRVTTQEALSDLLLVHHPGDSVSIGWTDTSGKTHNAVITLASGPAA